MIECNYRSIKLGVEPINLSVSAQTYLSCHSFERPIHHLQLPQPSFKMRLSVLAVTAGFAASSVAHPLMGHEHEYEHKHKHGMTPKVLGGIIDEEIIVVPTKEDMITPQTYKHHHHKEEHHHNKHGGGSGPIIVKAADGSLEYLSTESESNHHKRPKHHGSGGNTPTILVENSDGSVSVVEVETEPENHHHKHHGGYQKEHEKHHHQHHGGGSSSLEEVDGVVYETEPENHHHKHHGGYQKEHEKHHHKHHGGGSGSTPSSSHGVESSGKAGRIPGNPLYVDIGTSLATEPPLFPDNTFLTRREIEVFRDLTTGIVEGQKAMMECVPVTVPSCEVSLVRNSHLSLAPTQLLTP